MSTIATVTNDSIVGLSGKTLRLSNLMKKSNISGEYRIGAKNLMDLYPSRVREKILADVKLKTWDEPNKKALSEIAREIGDFDAKNPSKFLF